MQILKTARQSPTDPEFVQNPFAFYAAMRGAGDLFFWEDYGHPMALSHRAVSTILRDRRFGRPDPMSPAPEGAARSPVFYGLEANSLLELEPPVHTRIRALVARGFSTQHIQRSAPAISQLTDSYMDRFPDAPFDFVEAFARDLPVAVIVRLLGVPESMSGLFQAWSNAMVKMYLPHRGPQIEADAEAAATEFRSFLEEFIALRRKQPADDFLTTLIAAEESGDRLTTDELLSTVVLLLNAGHEATVHTLGNAAHTILTTGMDLCALRPAFLRATVEELFRYRPSLHMFMRYANQPVELFGHRFERGDKVGLLLAAANRDPAVFADPDSFDPTREDAPHVTFGAGVHFCIGAPLARLQMQIALPLIFSRHPKLRLVEEARFANIYHFHGLDSLRVQV